MPPADKASFLRRYTDVTNRLQSAHRELAQLLAAEHECKTRAWFASEENTLQGRDRIASFNALNLTLDIIRLKGEIAALNEEKDLIVLCLTHAQSLDGE